jgi:multidrug resistance efflux pump
VKVEKGDVLASFDRVSQEDAARDAEGKFDDLSHQVEQRQAQNRADAETRRQALSAAEGDLEKADLELRKGPILSEIDRLKNESKKRDAVAHLASLKRSQAAREKAGVAALRILELQRDRQRVALERAQGNLTKLTVKAPLGGMVALSQVWRNNSLGYPQEGDQLWIGEPLVRIFDASQMRVRLQVGEPDGACLKAGATAEVRLDAYPGLAMPARYESSSPIAAGAMRSPIRTFAARFLLDVRDERVLPDLSAVVSIALDAEPGKGS